MLDKIRIFAADIDGTLALKGEDLMPKTRAALKRLHEEGVLIGPASGRPLDDTILRKAKEWQLGFEFDFAIGMNGGDLWTKETGKIEHFYQLKKEDVREILEFIWDLDINVIVYENAYAYVKCKRMDDFMRDSQKRNHSYVEVGDIDCLSMHDTGKIETQMARPIEPLMWETVRAHQKDSWICVKTFQDAGKATIEFMDPHIQKGVALEQYTAKVGIPMKEVIAFGDLDNDIGLLRTAGWGVCLKNGSDTAKAEADAVTEYSVTEDGVGHYLEDHWFNR